MENKIEIEVGELHYSIYAKYEKSHESAKSKQIGQLTTRDPQSKQQQKTCLFSDRINPFPNDNKKAFRERKSIPSKIIKTNFSKIKTIILYRKNKD